MEQEVKWGEFLRTHLCGIEKTRTGQKEELNCDATNTSADPTGSSEVEVALQRCPKWRQGRCAFVFSAIGCRLPRSRVSKLGQKAAFCGEKYMGGTQL